jgi:hypothetical protein
LTQVYDAQPLFDELTRRATARSANRP